MAEGGDFHAQMQALRQSYVDRLPGKLSDISAQWVAYSHDWDHAALVELHRAVHNITGSGAVYGCVSVSEAARPLDILLASMIESAIAPSAAQQAQFTILLDGLRAAANDPDGVVAGDPDPRSLLALATSGGEEAQVGDGRIYLATTDQELVAEMQPQLSHFSYSLQSAKTVSGLRAAMAAAAPAAIILDADAFRADMADLEAMQALKRSGPGVVPLVFVSSSADIQVRLEAVRAGGDAFFSRPVDVAGLIDKLDMLTAHPQQDPYRVLIVDDERALAEYYALTLQQAGIITATIPDPLQVLKALIEFRPDLILMDVYMPVCTGLELATVIRQQEDFVSIPIVFLSAETDFRKQMAAMSHGGDDFLTKPIQPSHLVAAVASRAQRSRVLRSLMVRDSLTGLLNHTATKEYLEIEMSRAQRHNSPLAFAMLDLDHFKRVNDSHGHAAGDRVIKSLARLLQQRLRKTDIIGRYGGEEFAAILVDTDAATAVAVIAEIRSHFHQIEHQSDAASFAVTLSAGVAASPPWATSSELADAADKALYQAKRAGRNRVESSPKLDESP